MEFQISPHIPFLKGYPLARKRAKWTKSEVPLGNDVQMGWYGEHQLGAARGCAHVIGIFIGTGIGGVLIINGKLHRGAYGIAGDIGHYLVQPLGSHQFGRLGLGLAIAQHLVELHGGKISARSAGIGSGSVFTIELPAAKAANPMHKLEGDSKLKASAIVDQGAAQMPGL